MLQVSPMKGAMFETSAAVFKYKTAVKVIPSK